MKAIETKMKNKLAMIMRLLIIPVTAFSFHSFRFVLLFLGIILLFTDSLRAISPHKYKRTLIILDCVVIIWILSMYWLYYPIENLRFQLFEKKYDVAVEEILPELENAGDTSWSTYKLKTVFPLAVNNEIIYYKHGGSVAIFFSTFHSTFTDAGFIYFSDKTARDFFEHPSKYDEDLEVEPSYDYIADYTPKWAYIKLY